MTSPRDALGKAITDVQTQAKVLGAIKPMVMIEAVKPEHFAASVTIDGIEYIGDGTTAQTAVDVLRDILSRKIRNPG